MKNYIKLYHLAEERSSKDEVCMDADELYVQIESLKRKIDKLSKTLQ